MTTEPEYTHMLLIPVAADQTSAAAGRLSEAFKNRLPAHIQPLVVAGMTGNAVLIPLEPGAQP